MAGEIKINDVSIATESGGTVTLGNATLGSTVVLGTNASPIASNLVLAAGNGIDFSAASGSAAGSSSAVLDDYEQGTWEGSLVSTSGSITISTSYNTGEYIKIGNLVYFNIHARVSAISSPSGELAIGGLPFTRRSGSGGLDRSGVFIWAHNIGTPSGSSLQGYISVSANTVRIQEFNNGVLDTSSANGVSTSTEFNVTGCYIAN